MYQTMTKKSVQKIVSIRPILMDMSVGATVSFPVERLRSVRATASELGFILGRKYTTHTDRVSREIQVLREE